MTCLPLEVVFGWSRTLETMRTVPAGARAGFLPVTIPKVWATAVSVAPSLEMPIPFLPLVVVALLLLLLSSPT